MFDGNFGYDEDGKIQWWIWPLVPFILIWQVYRTIVHGDSWPGPGC